MVMVMAMGIVVVVVMVMVPTRMDRTPRPSKISQCMDRGMDRDRALHYERQP